MPRRAQPVPPIFQPEVAAEAILWAAARRRREVLVGWPTVKAVMSNKFVPGYIDRYLASRGYDAQQTDEPELPDRSDNLYAPVVGDHGAHGRFDARARSFSAQWWVARHALTLIGALTIAFGLAWELVHG